MKWFLCVLFCFCSVQARVTPDYFPQCKRNDPQIEKCILDAVDRLKGKLVEGIPDFNVPSIEPFVLPTIRLDRTAPNLRIKAVIKKMTAYGGSDFKVEKLKVNLNNKYVTEVKISIPKLRVTADYDVRGSRLLLLEVDGRGAFKANISNVVVVIKGAAKPIIKEDVEYLQIDKIIAKVRVGNAQIDVDDFDRPGAASSAAAFFNASPGTVLDILNPLIEDTAAAILKAYLNKVLGSVPLKEVLLD